MARYVKHTSCPKCGSSDANAVYDDGSTYCFSCRRPSGSRVSPLVLQKEEETETISLPPDCTTSYHKNAVEWITKYITIEQALKHDVLYSSFRHQVVFPFYGENKTLLAYQARNLSATNHSKRYYTKGDVNDILPIYSYSLPSSNINQTLPKKLVLVEDCLSAIKVAEVLQGDAMACLGSGINLTKLARLKPFYDVLEVFLDPDMWHKAMALTRQASSMGFTARSIRAYRDPKEYNEQELIEILK